MWCDQVWKKKKIMPQNSLSLSEMESVVVDEDVAFPRWPPWEFGMAKDIKHGTISLRIVSNNYSSCQKKSRQSDPGFNFTGQRSFVCHGVKLFYNLFDYTSISEFISLYIKKKKKNQWKVSWRSLYSLS